MGVMDLAASGTTSNLFTQSVPMPLWLVLLFIAVMVLIAKK